MKSLLLLSILVSCGTPQAAHMSDSQASNRAPEYCPSVIAKDWIRIFPLRSHFPTADFRIDGSGVLSIDPAMVPTAVMLLGSESSRTLSAKQLVDIGAGRFANSGDRIPVLVRGVGMKVGRGANDSGISQDRVRVYFRDGVAVVSRFGYRKDAFEFEPAPVVALFPRIPTEVYVEPSYGISEGVDSTEN